MRKAVVCFAVVLAIAGLAGCVPGTDKDLSIAVKVLTQGAYSGSSAPATRSLALRSVTGTTADFSGSAYEADAEAALFSVGLAFTDQAVEQDGETYVVDGNLSYAFGLSSPGGSGTLTFTAYLYGSGIAISGPDYEDTVDVDLKEMITVSVVDTTVSLSSVVEGTVDDEIVAETVSFTFEVSVP
jgi:hypothetical protein